MTNADDRKIIHAAKQNGLDVRNFLEAIEDSFAIQVITASSVEKRYHMRAMSTSGNFAFMIFNQNIFFPLNSRLTMFVTANKHTTYKWLQAYHIPTIPTYLIKELSSQQLKQLLNANSPMVIKATTGQGGVNVRMDVRSTQDIKDFLTVRQEASALLQPEIKGNDYRLVFLRGELIGAVRRIPATVVGDGRSSVQELAMQADVVFNAQGRGRLLQEKVLPDCSADLLSQIPQKGEVVSLTHRASFSLGGTAVEVTGDIPPATVELMQPLLRELGANLIGVDILSEDITKPLTETGVVVELNATPGMLPIVFARQPQDGSDKKIYSTIINSIDLNQ